MNTADLAERIATQHEMSKADARRLVDGVLAAIAEAATAGEEVALSGFGRFKVAERAARQGRNPATGEAIQIAASRKLAFAPAKQLRDAMNPAGGKPGSKTGGKSSSGKAAAPAGQGKAPSKAKAAPAAPARNKKAG